MLNTVNDARLAQECNFYIFYILPNIIILNHAPALSRRKVFVQRSNLFGDDHVDTLTAMYNVGSCLMKQEKFEDAISQLDKVMEKRKNHIGM